MILITIICLLCLESEIRGAIFANDLGGRGPGVSTETGIEPYVIEGSAYFFLASQNISNLFYEGELAARENKINTQNCLTAIDATLLNLNFSKEKFKQAITLAKLTAFSETKISLLRTFDYEKFSSQRKLLNEIMVKVKGYLSNGDIAGFYQQIVNDIDVIIKQLETIRANIESNIDIKGTEYWDILTNIENLTLFGNYGTQVGRTIF